jgi:hypothetical protein
MMTMMRLHGQYTSFNNGARKKREARDKGWYEVGRVAGIVVDVYFGRILHGKHAVDASGICMMLITGGCADPCMIEGLPVSDMGFVEVVSQLGVGGAPCRKKDLAKSR